LLSRQKHEAPLGLSCLTRAVLHGGSMPHWCGSRQSTGVRIPREGSLGIGTHVPYEAHNLVLTAGDP
jgi:hypothetical protein